MHNVTLRRIYELFLLRKSNIRVCALALSCVWLHVALLLQHATRTHCILTSCVAPVTPSDFLF
jgi:hypothetical protein